MRRRSIVSMSGAAMLGAALPAYAQTQRVKRMGVLTYLPESHPQVAALYKLYWGELMRLGWEEGRNLIVERAASGLDPELLPALAKELVAKGVDVIQTGPVGPTIAAARATQTIPIVFFGADIPVERGLVDSLARPGRNVTGFTSNTGSEFHGKKMQLLREIAPTAKRLSWLWGAPIQDTDTVSGAGTDLTATISSAAKQLGFESRFHRARRPEDIAGALAEIAAWPADAIAIHTATLATAEGYRQIAEFALRHRLPSLTEFSLGVDAGVLFSYAVAPSEVDLRWVRGAGYVDRILRGAKPADLPVQQPTRFELIINLKTAKALGLKVPQSMLISADRVIE